MRPRIINLLAISSVVLGMLSVFVAYHGRVSRFHSESNLDVILPEVRLRNVSLADGLQFLRNRAGVNIAVDWKSLDKYDVDEHSTINLDLRDVSILAALQAMLDQFQSRVRLGYHLDRDVIMIDTGFTWEPTPDHLEAHVYNVQDLIDWPSRVRGTEHSLTDAGHSPSDDPIRIDDALRDVRLSRLMQLLQPRQRLETRMAGWAGRLFVIDTPGEHNRIRQTLESLRVEEKQSGTSPLDVARRDQW